MTAASKAFSNWCGGPTRREAYGLDLPFGTRLIVSTAWCSRLAKARDLGIFCLNVCDAVEQSDGGRSGKQDVGQGAVAPTVRSRMRVPEGRSVGVPTSRPQSASRIPSLDGLRAVSIAGVILGHLAGSHGFPSWLTVLIGNRYVDFAQLGVRMFFAISGFLITGLLLAEHERTGQISLKRFYLRRTLRILPAYFAFLAAVALGDAVGLFSVPRADFVHALTYTVNYAPDAVWHIGHLWSLAVEEQFYLLWPAVVVFAGTRRSTRIAVAVLCAVPLIRVAESILWPQMWPHWRPRIGMSFETAADALAIGCLLALGREKLWSNPRYRAAVSSRWVALACLVLGLVISYRYRPGLLLGISVENIGLILIIDRAVRQPSGTLGRLLNSRALVAMGVLSYSLYLWQQPFLNRHADAPMTRFPLNLFLAVVCAVACYWSIERPALALRVRLERRFFDHPGKPHVLTSAELHGTAPRPSMAGTVPALEAQEKSR
jgi:peptidoglycan/LPS O-acetylase OafA/YrhL